MSAQPVTLPPVYLLLRQCPRKGCDVLRIDGTSETILFHGNRWQARARLAELQRETGLRAFNVKERTREAVRRGISATVLECPAPSVS
jgi:hypothetical protein